MFVATISLLLLHVESGFGRFGSRISRRKAVRLKVPKIKQIPFDTGCYVDEVQDMLHESKLSGKESAVIDWTKWESSRFPVTLAAAWMRCRTCCRNPSCQGRSRMLHVVLGADLETALQVLLIGNVGGSAWSQCRTSDLIIKVTTVSSNFLSLASQRSRQVLGCKLWCFWQSPWREAEPEGPKGPEGRSLVGQALRFARFTLCSHKAGVALSTHLRPFGMPR